MDGRGIAFLDVETGAVRNANRVGARIWEGAAAGKTLDGIVAEISREFEAPEAVVRQDAERFFRELTRAGILVPAGR
jgi:hypothetical protein